MYPNGLGRVFLIRRYLVGLILLLILRWQLIVDTYLTFDTRFSRGSPASNVNHRSVIHAVARFVNIINGPFGDTPYLFTNL